MLVCIDRRHLRKRLVTVALKCCVLCSRIPDSVGKDIEKACQSIYPLHDVYVRKVKMLKKPKFECKWYTAILDVHLCFCFWEQMMTVSVPDDLLITTHWDQLTFPNKVIFHFPFHSPVWNSLTGFLIWFLKHHYIIVVFHLKESSCLHFPVPS